MNANMKSISIGAAIGVLVQACGSAEQVGEKTGRQAEALGEVACGTRVLTTSAANWSTTSATDGAAVTTPTFHCFWDDELTSGSSYGSADCPNQFIVEVGVPYPGWTIPTDARFFVRSPTSDQGSCQKLHVTLGAYAFDSTGWHEIGSYVAHGVWRSQDGLFGPYCDLVAEINTIPFPLKPGYTKIRAAASAYTVELLKGSPYNSYAPVTAGIYGGNGC